MEEKKVGDYLDGNKFDKPFEVCNAVGSTKSLGAPSRAKFWEQSTGCDFSKRKCGILGCGANAQLGGLMWIKRRWKFCFIMPICQQHGNLDYPNYAQTNKDIRLVACELTDDDAAASNCHGMEVGYYFYGQFEVSNVVGSTEDGGSMAKFWSDHTPRDFYKQKCGILGCGSDAEVGGHMWIKRLSKFCFILPICKKHNSSPDLHYPKFMSTKGGVCLVARNKTPGMSR